MQSIEGIVMIVQESRFQLTDTKGVSHMFELYHSAAAEPEQLTPLQRDQTRVRVDYDNGENVIGFVARSDNAAERAKAVGQWICTPARWNIRNPASIA